MIDLNAPGTHGTGQVGRAVHPDSDESRPWRDDDNPTTTHATKSTGFAGPSPADVRTIEDVTRGLGLDAATKTTVENITRAGDHPYMIGRNIDRVFRRLPEKMNPALRREVSSRARRYARRSWRPPARRAGIMAPLESRRLSKSLMAAIELEKSTPWYEPDPENVQDSPSINESNAQKYHDAGVWQGDVQSAGRTTVHLTGDTVYDEDAIEKAEEGTVGWKIKKLLGEGKGRDQAIAIALDMERRGELRKGVSVEDLEGMLEKAGRVLSIGPRGGKIVGYVGGDKNKPIYGDDSPGKARGARKPTGELESKFPPSKYDKKIVSHGSNGAGRAVFSKRGPKPRGEEFEHGGAGGGAHVGLCLTDDNDSARSYARTNGGEMITTFALDMDDLKVVNAEGYDRDKDEALGDDGKPIEGADVIIYEDEDPSGQPHTTWRVVSEKAKDAAVPYEHTAADAEGIEDWADEFPDDPDQDDIEFWLDDAPRFAAFNGWVKDSDKDAWVKNGKKANSEEVAEVEFGSMSKAKRSVMKVGKRGGKIVGTDKKGNPIYEKMNQTDVDAGKKDAQGRPIMDRRVTAVDDAKKHADAHTKATKAEGAAKVAQARAEAAAAERDALTGADQKTGDEDAAEKPAETDETADDSAPAAPKKAPKLDEDPLDANEGAFDPNVGDNGSVSPDTDSSETNDEIAALQHAVAAIHEKLKGIEHLVSGEMVPMFNALKADARRAHSAPSTNLIEFLLGRVSNFVEYVTKGAALSAKSALGAGVKGGKKVRDRVMKELEEKAEKPTKKSLAEETEELEKSFLTVSEVMEYNSRGPVITAPPFPNRDPHPYVGQIELPGKVRVLVENEQGSTRSGVDSDGRPWETVMPAHYGEIMATKGTDGDPLDIFVGENIMAPWVYVIAIQDPSTMTHDEDKAFFGFATRADAEACYRAAYDRRDLKMETRRLSLAEFLDWVHDHENHDRRIEVGKRMKKSKKMIDDADQLLKSLRPEEKAAELSRAEELLAEAEALHKGERSIAKLGEAMLDGIAEETGFDLRTDIKADEPVSDEPVSVEPQPEPLKRSHRSPAELLDACEHISSEAEGELVQALDVVKKGLRGLRAPLTEGDVHRMIAGSITDDAARTAGHDVVPKLFEDHDYVSAPLAKSTHDAGGYYNHAVNNAQGVSGHGEALGSFMRTTSETHRPPEQAGQRLRGTSVGRASARPTGRNHNAFIAKLTGR